MPCIPFVTYPIDLICCRVHNDAILLTLHSVRDTTPFNEESAHSPPSYYMPTHFSNWEPSPLKSPKRYHYMLVHRHIYRSVRHNRLHCRKYVASPHSILCHPLRSQTSSPCVDLCAPNGLDLTGKTFASMATTKQYGHGPSQAQLRKEHKRHDECFQEPAIQVQR